MAPGQAQTTSDEDLRRAVEATVTRYQLLGVEGIIDDLACFAIDRDRPQVYDANHVRAPRAASPTEIGELLARIAEVYDGHDGYDHHEVACDLDTPDAFEARLCLDGWQLDTTLQQLLSGPLLFDGSPGPPGLAMRPATSDVDWQSMTTLTRINHLESSRTFARESWSLELTESMVEHRRLKAPEMQPWMASLAGIDIGFLSAMPGENGVGLIDDLFVHPDFRSQGIGLALLDWCVADARTRGAEQVTLSSRPDDWPRHLYARLGFRPLFVERSWERYVETGLE